MTDVYGIDFSTSYIPNVSPAAAALLAAAGIGHACIGYDSSPASAAVRKTLVDAGLGWSAYRFLYTYHDPAAQVNDCLAGIHASDVLPVYFTVDIEDYPAGNWPTISQIEAAMDATEAGDVRPGQLVVPVIYTRQEFASIYPGYTGPADRGWGLWSANWATGGMAAIDTIPLYSGWQRSQLVGHQYTGDSASPIGTVDHDLFRLPTPAAPPPTGGPDMADVIARLLRAQEDLAALGVEIESALEDART